MAFKVVCACVTAFSRVPRLLTVAGKTLRWSVFPSRYNVGAGAPTTYAKKLLRIVTEQYIDKDGKTVLWRRFNRNDWGFGRYGKLWTELRPENECLTVNGDIYVHWYDTLATFTFFGKVGAFVFYGAILQRAIVFYCLCRIAVCRLLLKL